MTGPPSYVYTCLFGGYEPLTEQPVAERSGCTFVCFTDDAALRSETWEIERVAPILPLDATRSSRHPKLFPYRYLPATGTSLYIDNSVRLLRPPDDLIRTSLRAPGTGLALASHSFHTSLREEAEAIVDHGFDSTEAVAETMDAVRALAPRLVEAKPFWGGLLIRRHEDVEMRSAMEEWWALLLRYSRRDQLTLPLVLERHRALQTQVLELDNHRSALHEWPVTPRKRHPIPDQATEGGADTTTATLHELTTSLSWRITRPLRGAGQMLRRARSRARAPLRPPDRSHRR